MRRCSVLKYDFPNLELRQIGICTCSRTSASKQALMQLNVAPILTPGQGHMGAMRRTWGPEVHFLMARPSEFNPMILSRAHDFQVDVLIH